MLADARQGRFDTIVCWKSDRLSWGMYPAAALMEVVEAHQIRLEAVLDAHRQMMVPVTPLSSVRTAVKLVPFHSRGGVSVATPYSSAK